MDGREAVRERIAHDLVAFSLELALGAARNAVRYVDGIARGRESRRAHRLHHGHVEVDGVQEHLEDAHGDLRRPRRPDHDMGPVALEDDGGHHRAEARLARSEAACPAWPRVEDAHAAVVHETQAFRDHARWHAEGVRHRDAIAFGVQDGDVRRVAAWRPAGIEPRHVRLLLAAYLFCEGARVRLVRETLHRHVDEARVANVAVLVDGGTLHGLRHDTDVLRGVVVELLEREALQDVQHLDEHDAAPRGPVAGDTVSAIRPPEGRVAHGPPVAEISDVEETAVAAHVLPDGLTDLTLVEDLIAVLGDEAEGLAQIAVHHVLADALRRPVGPAVEGAPCGREREPLLATRAAHLPFLGPPVRDARANRPSALRPRDGGLHDLLPGQPPVLAMSIAIRAKARGH